MYSECVKFSIYQASTLNQNSSSEEIAETLGELSNIANITTEINDTDVTADLTRGELQALAETLDTVANVIVSDTLTDEISDVRRLRMYLSFTT